MSDSRRADDLLPDDVKGVEGGAMELVEMDGGDDVGKGSVMGA